MSEIDWHEVAVQYTEYAQELADKERMNKSSFIVGYVARLMIELDEIIGTVTAWGVEHDIEDEEQIRQQLIARQGSLLTLRSRDLVRHVLNAANAGPMGTTQFEGHLARIPEMGKADFTPVGENDMRYAIRLIMHDEQGQTNDH